MRETIDALKDNIHEAIGEIQLHTIDNVLKNWTKRVGYSNGLRNKTHYLRHYVISQVYVNTFFFFILSP